MGKIDQAVGEGMRDLLGVTEQDHEEFLSRGDKKAQMAQAEQGMAGRALNTAKDEAAKPGVELAQKPLQAKMYAAEQHSHRDPHLNLDGVVIDPETGQEYSEEEWAQMLEDQKNLNMGEDVLKTRQASEELRSGQTASQESPRARALRDIAGRVPEDFSSGSAAEFDRG